VERGRWLREIILTEICTPPCSPEREDAVPSAYGWGETMDTVVVGVRSILRPAPACSASAATISAVRVAQQSESETGPVE
jgi:hypothetical protein